MKPIRIFAASTTLVILMAVTSSLAGANARAVTPPSISVYTTAPAFAPGADAAFIVRAEGDGVEFAALRFTAEGGTLSGVLGLPSMPPAGAEGVVFVQRDTPGEATLTVHLGGQPVASGTAFFGAATGRIHITTTLVADAGAAARTWRYEVVDASGSVVESLSLGTSGDAPTATAETAALPFGRYTVRQVLGGHTGTACASGMFYAVSSPAGAATTVELGPTEATAVFSLQLCPDAPPTLAVDRPVDEPAEPIDEVRGTRTGPAPLPPATGSGLAIAETRTATFDALLILFMVTTHLALIPAAWWWRRSSMVRRG